MGFTSNGIVWLNHIHRINLGAENESVKRKPRKKKKRREIKLPSLSRVSFEDSLRALLNTPPPKSKRAGK
jgi:hypothetical protein